MAYILQHSTLGFCWWDLVALVALIVVIGFFVVNHRKQKERIKELEEQVSAIYADDTLKEETVSG